MPCCNQGGCAKCLFISGWISLLLCPILALLVAPRYIQHSMLGKLTLDTQQKVSDMANGKDLDALYHDKTTVSDSSFTFWNCTNCLELQEQNSSSSVKPIFQAVTVDFDQINQNFDGYSREDGNVYEYKEWEHYRAREPQDLNKQIVQVNPAYLGAIYALAPSEKMLFVGLAHVILGMVYNGILASKYGPGILASSLPSALGITVSTNADVAAIQFSSGKFTLYTPGLASNSISKISQLAENGVCVDVELFAYLNSATSPLKSGDTDFSFTMTTAQATKFAATFTLAQSPFQLAHMLQLVYASSSTAAALFATFAGTWGTLTSNGVTVCDLDNGVSSSSSCLVLAAAYHKYLTSYLPEMFFVGCNLVGTVQPDGTGSKNSALFVRRTVGEILYGYEDPLFGIVPSSAVPAGVKLEYNGLITTNFDTLEQLEAAFANGSLAAEDFTYRQYSGKEDLADAGKFFTYGNITHTEPGDTAYPGYGDDGRPGHSFNIQGMHSISVQRPRKTTYPNFIQSSLPPQVDPDFEEAITAYQGTAARRLRLVCPDGCPFSEVKGIQTKAFELYEFEGILSYNGSIPQAVVEGCKGSVSANYEQRMSAIGALPTGAKASTCDYGMRYDFVFDLSIANKAPIGLSLPLLGLTSSHVRGAVSFIDNNGAEINYSKGEHLTSVILEPMTGRAIKGEERLQFNFYIEQTMIDSDRYQNIFASPDDNSNVFIWPYSYLDRKKLLTDDDASAFKSAVYFGFMLQAVLLILGVVGGVCCLGISFCALRRGRSSDKTAQLPFKSEFTPSTALDHGGVNAYNREL